MKWFKRSVIALCIVFVLIQLIQPARNKSAQVFSSDFLGTYKPPDTVRQIIQTVCYDCHSNNTNYPWYAGIQPMAWLMASHIKNGKRKLNFSEFSKNSNRKQISKLQNITDQIRDGEMPLYSYKLMHKTARLSENERSLLIHWLQSTADSLSFR